MLLPKTVAIQTDVLSILLWYPGEGSVSVQLYLVQQIWLLLPRPRNRPYMDDALVGSGIFSFVYTTMRYGNEVSWVRIGM